MFRPVSSNLATTCKSDFSLFWAVLSGTFVTRPKTLKDRQLLCLMTYLSQPSNQNLLVQVDTVKAKYEDDHNRNGSLSALVYQPGTERIQCFTGGTVSYLFLRCPPGATCGTRCLLLGRPNLLPLERRVATELVNYYRSELYRNPLMHWKFQLQRRVDDSPTLCLPTSIPCTSKMLLFSLRQHKEKRRRIMLATA